MGGGQCTLDACRFAFGGVVDTYSGELAEKNGDYLNDKHGCIVSEALCIDFLEFVCILESVSNKRRKRYEKSVLRN